MSLRLSGPGIALLLTLTWLSPLPSGAANVGPGSLSDPVQQINLLLNRLNRYRDGLERSARLLSLEEALRLGLSANPSLRQAWAAVREADWSVVSIQREWWPSLIAGSDDPGILGWTTTSSREQIRTPQGRTKSVTISGGQSSLPNLNLTWTFLDPSRDSRVNAARSQVAARRFLFDVDARDLVLRIQSAYYVLQEQRDLERDYRSLYDTLSELVARGMPPGSDKGRIDQLRTEQLSLLTLRISTHESVIQAADALALAQADLDRLSVTRQVQDNHAALLASVIVVDVARQQLQVADDSLQAAARDFRSGRSDATRVVQAISAFRDSAESYRGSVRQHNTAIAGLYRQSALWPEGTWSMLTTSFPQQATPLRPIPAP